MTHMTDKTFIKRDKNLLKLAQNIFGIDLVVDAFHCIYDCGDENTNIKEIYKAIYKYDVEADCKEIDFDGNEIRLVLCNGNIVHFSVSEWGDIKSPYNNNEYCEI